MPFGTLIRSWPAPGAAGSNHGPAWVNGLLYIEDHKNGLALQVDVMSLTVNRSIALPSLELMNAGGDGTNFLSLAGTTFSLRDLWTGKAVSTVTDAAQVGGCLTTRGLYVISATGGVREYTPTATGWMVTRSVGLGTGGTFTSVAVKHPYAYLGNTTATQHVAKIDMATWTVVATAALPFAGGATGIDVNGTSIYLSSGGTDRIYEVSLA